jgi:hypothetical protein
MTCPLPAAVYPPQDMDIDYPFQQRCEKIAVEQRRLLHIPPYAPLPGSILTDRHGVLVLLPADLPGAVEEDVACLASRQDWDGCLLTDLPDYPPVIVLRPDLPPTRRESTIMHEMGHLLLGHDPLTWDFALGVFTPRRPRDENEATHLGGCLQIPRVGLVYALQTGWDVAGTAEHFGASEQMVRFRMNVTGVRLPR